MQDELGEQYIQIQTNDPLLVGEFTVKIYATEQAKGMTNSQASFVLRISESILTLAEEPSQFYRGTKIVLVTHDMGQAKRIADEIVFMSKGRVAEFTPAESFFSRPQSEAARAYLNGRLVI